MATGLNQRPSGASYPADACLGLRLPEEADRQLKLASQAGLHEAALDHLRAAWQAAPGYLAGYGLYRFYFYRHRLAEASEVAACLKQVAGELKIASGWLFTLKAYAYKLRLGKLEEGQSTLAKLLMNVLSGQTHGLED